MVGRNNDRLLASKRKRPLKTSGGINVIIWNTKRKQKLLFLSTVFIACLIYYYGPRYFNLSTIVPSNSHSPSIDIILNRDAEESAKPYEGDTFPLDKVISPGPMWGTLSSGQYFGQRISAPLALEAGLIWFDNRLHVNKNRLNIRHLCNQADGLRTYSWREHNFHSYGQQVIEDDDFTLEATFIRDDQNPMEWSAQVSVKSSNITKGPISLIYYLTKDRSTDKIDLVSSRSQINESDNKEKNVNLAEIHGHSRETGNFIMTIGMNNGTEKFIYGNFLRLDFDKSKYPYADICHYHLLRTHHNGNILYIMPGNKIIPGFQDSTVDDPNFVAYQLILEPPASFIVSFMQSQVSKVSGADDFDAKHKRSTAIFNSQFNKLFLSRFEGRHMKDPKIIEMAKVALSNMVGSIGYFYGNSYIMNDNEPKKLVPYGPIQLLTAVPSRSFFPRGFLWDEGFHNILISRWDPALSTSIIKSWFNIMNLDGWMPREVILGVESLRRVPAEFVVQKTSNANPPTMFLPIEYLIDTNGLDIGSVRQLYPRLKSWFNWYNTTQSGEIHSTFRWRGRDKESDNMLNPKTLTSGLDDYPRATHPSSHEYHLDLRCWIALAARTMSKLSKYLGDDVQYKYYKDQYDLLRDNKLLEELHWSEEHQIFCDFGFNSPEVELIKVDKKRIRDGREETYQEMVRLVKSHAKFDCVPELGYVTLFPIIMQLLEPDNKKLGILLEYIKDENKLWSPYGVRSLSKTSHFYNQFNTEHDPPYWRGAIWLNINYLLLKSLEYYSNIQGPYQARSEEIYKDLKDNLIRTVHDQYVSTNYIWENYSDLTGRGKGSHPFTGWSSLILLILLGKS